MEHRDRIKLDKEFVKKQIPLTKNMVDLAKVCGCGKDKMRHFIFDNGLYKYYCETHNKKYNPAKEDRKCCICGYDKGIERLHGQPYCKRHYNHMVRYGKPLERTCYTMNDIITEGEISRIILRDKYQNITGEAIIDTEDVDKIKNYKWYLESEKYAVTKGINSKMGIDISNVIFNNFETKYDHISHNRLDNRKINLRPITSQQNSMNMSKKKTNTSGVIGVGKQMYNKEWTGRWYASIMLNYKQIWLGIYQNFNDAVVARLQGEIKYFGEYSPHYNPETKTIQLEYINPDSNIKHYLEYDLSGELLNNYKQSA